LALLLVVAQNTERVWSINEGRTEEREKGTESERNLKDGTVCHGITNADYCLVTLTQRHNQRKKEKRRKKEGRGGKRRPGRKGGREAKVGR
jgi:microcompartment protein CcmL/EutN